MDLALMVVLVALLWAITNRMHRSIDEETRAMERRIGWGYGYGAGYNDAMAGREYNLDAPESGKVRGI